MRNNKLDRLKEKAADDFKKAYLAGEHTKKLIDEAVKAARKVPRTASVSRVAFRYASKSM